MGERRQRVRKGCSWIIMTLLLMTLVFAEGSYQVQAATTISVSYDMSQIADVRVNNTHVFNGSGSVTADENSANEIFLQTHPSRVFKTITINGTDVTNLFTMTEGKTKAVCNNYEPASVYRIEVTTESDGRYSIQWAYDDAFGQDALVEHGRVEVISIGGNTVNETQGPVYVEAGKRVKIRLIPNYGYQISGVSLNGGASLSAESERSIFTFTMPAAHIHLKGIFSAASDTVVNQAGDVVSSGTLGNGKAVADNGTAEMTLSNANMDVGSLPGNASLLDGEEQDQTKKIQSVDITTKQKLSKGDGTYWETPKSDLTGEAEISLKMKQSAAGYAVIREHNGEYKDIPSNYDPSTEILQFGSDQFSTYILVPLTTAKNNYMPISPATGGNTVKTGKEKASGGHIHSYEWQTIQTATAEQDGLEAYACTICGSYQESVPVSAYGYACTEAAKKLVTAKQGQTITLDMGRWCSYPRWFMEKIAERNDLTVKLQFEYLHKQYEVTIPAGKAVDTACDWYGPLKLCELYGYTVQ